MPDQSERYDPETIRVYWQPGCSSCVKIKEFLSAKGVDFVPINVLEDASAMEDLLVRGIRTVPVVIQGDRMVYGQSLTDVAAFVNMEVQNKRLPAETLIARWMIFLDTGRLLVTRIPEPDMEFRPVPERNRTLRELSYHIFQIPESYLESVQHGLKDTRVITNAKYDHLRNRNDVLIYADSIIARMRAWEQTTSAASFEATMETYYGVQPAMQVLERGTWHSAQHARQLDFVLSERLGTDPVIPAATYEGLPMPEGIWA